MRHYCPNKLYLVVNIGSRFALMEVKAVLYYLLLNFKFEPNADTQIPLKLKKSPGGVATEKGVNLRLTPR